MKLAPIHSLIDAPFAANVHEYDRVDSDHVRRMIEYLGGMATADGYAFPSAPRRAEAIRLLSQRFGSKYFVTADS
jgi:hypothetical protein